MALTVHRLQPAFGQALAGGRALDPGTGLTAMGAGTNADIVPIAPIGQVVAAFRTGPGMVRDLVSGQAERIETLLRRLVERGGDLFLRRQGLSKPRQRVEMRPFLDGQLIERQMVGGEIDRLTQLRRPGFGRLTGPGIDQVEGAAREMLMRQIDGAARFRRRMFPAQEFQRFVVQRLDPQRYPIDPGIGIGSELAGLDRGRVRFQGDFDIVGGRHLRPRHRDQGARRFRVHQRGRAAAEEDRGQPPVRETVQRAVQFRQQRLAPARLVDAVPDMAVEIAIGAFGLAEGPMDIERQRRARRRLRSFGLRAHFEKQAATNWLKASARWLIACFSSGSISPKVRRSPSGTKIGS